MASYNEIEVHFTKSPDESLSVGTLAEKDNRLFFEYDSNWLTRGLELSPFTLPLQAGLISHKDYRRQDVTCPEKRRDPKYNEYPLTGLFL